MKSSGKGEFIGPISCPPGSMVSSSEVRIVCPSISLFAHLGASLGVSRSSPLIEGFVFKGNSLSVLLVDLLPLLC